MVYYTLYYANRIIFRNIFIDSLRKKYYWVVYIRTKVYLCHSLKFLSKSTKTFGHSKALAWESQGFVIVRSA